MPIWRVRVLWKERICLGQFIEELRAMALYLIDGKALWKMLCGSRSKLNLDSLRR